MDDGCDWRRGWQYTITVQSCVEGGKWMHRILTNGTSDGTYNRPNRLKGLRQCRGTQCELHHTLTCGTTNSAGSEWGCHFIGYQVRALLMLFSALNGVRGAARPCRGACSSLIDAHVGVAEQFCCARNHQLLLWLPLHELSKAC